MNNYTVEILTPSKALVRDLPAEALIVPTTRGQINILENHTHIVTKLDTGWLSVFGGADDADRHFAVSTGICKVLDGKVTVLAQTSEESKEIDTDRAKLALENAERRLANSDGLSDEDIEKYRRKAERAKLRIQMSDFTRSR